MSKRYLCFWIVVTILTLVVTSCGGGATPAPATSEPESQATTEPEAPAASQYKEAPILAEMVKAGTLPPVEERLPGVPFVVEKGVLISETDLPDWTPGQYGGTLRVGHSVANWNPDIFVMMDEALLQGQGIGMDGIQGNVVESFEVENDNKDFTFKIRKGLRWSDGEPVTTEDVRFTFEDMYANEKLYPSGIPNEFRVGFSVKGAKGTLQIIDDYTFKISFPEAYGGFVRNMWIEGWKGYTLVINPAHYLKQFHITYTKLEDMQEEMTAMNLSDEWWQYFANKRCQNWDMSNPRCANFPGLYPWILKDSGDPSLLIWERNPYYYKVDSNGQQLPYIDKIVSQQVDNVEMLNLKALTGEIDFMRESTALVKVPLYMESAEQAGFRVVLTDMHVDSSGIRLNQTFDDADWQSVVQDVRFRQAVSMAVNRQELIDTVYYGHASFPLELVGEEYSQFDVDAANRLLDDMGLTEKNADGIRLYPSGAPINILLEHAAHAPDLIPVADLVAQYLKPIGINVTVKQIDSSLFSERYNANQIQASVHWSHDRGWDNDAVSGSVARAGILWNQWVSTEGKEGVEPPEWIMKAYDIDSRRWQVISGSEEYKKVVAEGTQWCRDNLPYINFVENVKYPMVVSVKLGNMPQSGFAIAANFSGEQLFFKE
ncbi:MAG: ABC transporter substrate-binding protein [Anaerolineae bacterium]|nr:ABC transporter substrate-binding protein [Anaerolineae bacterium]